MSGLDDLRQQLADFDDRIVDWAHNEFKEAAQKALEEVVRKEVFRQAIAWTPVGETGNLQSTAHVVQLNELKFQIVYPMDYAIYVHEITEYEHDGRERAKFLAQAMWQVEWLGFAHRIALRMQKYL